MFLPYTTISGTQLLKANTNIRSECLTVKIFYKTAGIATDYGSDDRGVGI
jgi:hypothetical protein